MSKAVKKVLTVAAAIAVAYFAPQVAATIITGGAKGAAATATLAATSTATKVITTAAVNAAGNAAIAAATGGDVGKAAIIGAITGGVGGYTSSALNPAVTGGLQGSALTSQALTAAPGAAGAPAAFAYQPGVLNAAGTYTTSGLAGTAAAAPAVAGISSGLQGSVLTPEALAATSGASGAPAAFAYQPTGVTASLGQRALAAVQEAGGAIVDKFTDPKAIADMTLRAAGQLAGSAIAGSGLSPAEQKLLAAQAADLEELKRTNQELYNLRLEQAKAILGEAARDYGFETEQRARVATGAQTVAGLRGLTGERRRAEQARLRRGAQEQISTARAQGELMSAENVRQARQAGLAVLPTGGPQGGIMDARTSLMNMYGVGEARRQQQVGQVGDFLGALTGRQQAGLAGFSQAELDEETRRRKYGTKNPITGGSTISGSP